MPLFQIDIQKRWNEMYWTNVYHVEASDIPAARLIGYDIVSAERAIHMPFVLFVSMRTRPYPGPSEGNIQTLDAQGSAPAGDFLPMFNVVRVDFPTAIGRPSRKFLRTQIPETGTANGVLLPAYVSLIQTEYIAPLASLPVGTLVDIDGQALTTGILYPAVGMRQLRRGSKRVVTPVIPVA